MSTTPAEITRRMIGEVADRYGTSVEEILSRRGPKRLLRCRIEIAERLAARGYTGPKIGAIMNRDASTVEFYRNRLSAKQPSQRSLALMPVHKPKARPAPPPPPRGPVRYAGFDPKARC